MPNAVAYAENLVKQFEGLTLVAIPDTMSDLGKACRAHGLKLTQYTQVPGWQTIKATPWTIGRGYTGPVVHPGLEIDEDTADEWTLNRLTELEAAIEADLDVVLSDQEMGALIDFAYNLGIIALKDSTLWRMVNSNNSDINDECREIEKWDHADHVEVEGLKRRREAEANLFRQGYEVGGHV